MEDFLRVVLNYIKIIFDLRRGIILKLRNLFLILVFLFAVNSSSLAASKSDFMYLYRSEWTRANLKYKLSRVVENEFLAVAKSSKFHTFGFQLGFNANNIVEKIQKDIFTEFYGDYQELLDRLSKRLPEEHIKIQNEAERNFIKTVWPKLRAKLDHPFRPLNWFVMGFAVFILRGFFAKFLSDFFGKVFRRVKAVKMLKLAFSLTALMLIMVGVYHASQISTLTRSVARKFLYESTRDFYVSELPETFVNAFN